MNSTSVGELLIAGTQVGNNMKTRRRHNRNTQNITVCITHPKEVHLTEKTDIQSPSTDIHKMGAHQAVSRTKGGTHGPAEPQGRPAPCWRHSTSSFAGRSSLSS